MIATKKTESPQRDGAVRYISVIRNGDEGRVLTVAAGDINRTVDHERRIGSTIVGDYSTLHVAERAVRQALAGLKEHPLARKTS
jgi:hypothetical protein